jgi:hypothetical protein
MPSLIGSLTWLAAYNDLVGADSRYRMVTVTGGRRGGRRRAAAAVARAMAAIRPRRPSAPRLEVPRPYRSAQLRLPFDDSLPTPLLAREWYDEPDEVDSLAWMPVAHSFIPVTLPAYSARITGIAD